MASRDLVHSADSAASSLHGSTVGATAATVTGDAIDTNGYGSLTYFISAKPHTVGTIAITFEHSDNSAFSSGNEQIPVTDAATIAKNYINSTTGTIAYTAAEVAEKKIGINLDNTKRYHRAVVVLGTGIAGSYSVTAVLGHPRHRNKAV